MFPAVLLIFSGSFVAGLAGIAYLWAVCRFTPRRRKINFLKANIYFENILKEN